jgi:hypothetical protein
MKKGLIPDHLIADATKFRKTNVQKRQIKEISVEIIRNIADEIKRAHEEGRTGIITEMPEFYNICNMPEMDAHREVCFEVVMYLRQKLYNVAINSNDPTKIMITWRSKSDIAEIKVQKQILMQYMKPF